MFPALTVGIGIYLPLNVVVTIAIGGVIAWLSERSFRKRFEGEGAEPAYEAVRRRGILLASGFLVGESFVGVLLAAADTVTGRSASLTIAGPELSTVTEAAGLAVFLIAIGIFYRVVSRSPR